MNTCSERFGRCKCDSNQSPALLGHFFSLEIVQVRKEWDELRILFKILQLMQNLSFLQILPMSVTLWTTIENESWGSPFLQRVYQEWALSVSRHTVTWSTWRTSLYDPGPVSEEGRHKSVVDSFSPLQFSWIRIGHALNKGSKLSWKRKRWRQRHSSWSWYRKICSWKQSGSLDLLSYTLKIQPKNDSKTTL